MSALFSRTALIVTFGYAVLIAVLLLWVWRGSDAEGPSVGLLIIGLPWIVVLRSNSMLLYFVVLVLNSATVYVFVLSLVKVFERDRN
jgi:hypothetical protein